jgi:phosphoribosylpyrophosphate synthetase
MTLDPHACQIQGFYSFPGDVLNASSILVSYVKENLRLYFKDPVVFTADLVSPRKVITSPSGLTLRLLFPKNAVLPTMPGHRR